MNSVTRLYSIAPDKLAIKFDVGTVERGIGTDSDRFTETPLNDNQLFDPANYAITSTTDPNFSDPINPITNGISLKKKTTDVAFLNRFNPFDPNQVKWAKEYTLYLSLPDGKNLTPGERYTLDFIGDLELDLIDVDDFTFQPEATFNEAIHVSQIGFDPDDPKVAFLSEWLGTNSDDDPVSTPDNFRAGLRFWIVDAATGERIEDSGVVRTTQLSLAESTDEDVRDGFQNYSGTDVYEMDFSDFTRPGEYVIEVEGIGRSFDFTIAEDNWDKAFKISMQGLYNQRSGTAIGGPFSETEYQRSFHPDDGVKIFPTDERTIIVDGAEVVVEAVQLTDTTEGELGEVEFVTALANYATPFDRNEDGNVSSNELAIAIEPLENAWGGYKDAGDWDRRIQHLWGTRQHLELLETFPDYFESVDLNIPETTDSFATVESLNRANPDNGIPDLLDESLWSVDFFRRLQNEDGGIRGGIESAKSPRPGETSWQESLNIFAYAADPYSSYIYAGVAARTARVLANYDANLAVIYQESAIRAMNWAEAEVPTKTKYDRIEITDERNLAALELYLLTEDTRWNDIFLEDTAFAGELCVDGQPCADVTSFRNYDQQQAAFLYARAAQNLTDPTIRSNAAAAIERAAQNSLSVQNGGDITFNNVVGRTVNGTGFRWTKNNPFIPLIGSQLGVPQVEALLQAYTLTNNREYLEGAVLGSQFAAGANPSNTVFTSGLAKVGLADREAKNSFVIDARLTGQDAPSGITSYGPIDPGFQFSQFQTNLFRAETSPDPERWPTAEAYFDNYWNFQNTEFTVMESIAPSAYAWGYFAASDFEGETPLEGEVLIGTPGPNVLIGGSGADQIQGLAGNDRLSGGEGNDTLSGGAGRDILKGQGEDDRLVGGGDRDRLLGGVGNDRLDGGGGNDTLKGQAGNDLLHASTGNDTLMGGTGNDTLKGQSGKDMLTGGSGVDLFILAQGARPGERTSASRDRIRDFEDGRDLLGLQGGISFSDLSLTQRRSNVIISLGNDELAIVSRTVTADLTAADFISV